MLHALGLTSTRAAATFTRKPAAGSRHRRTPVLLSSRHAPSCACWRKWVPAAQVLIAPAQVVRHTTVMSAAIQEHSIQKSMPVAGNDSKRTPALLAAALGSGLLACLVTATGWVWIDTVCSVASHLAPAPSAAITPYLKVALVATHLSSFVLLPATMYAFWSRAAALRRAGVHNVFVPILGLAFMMVAIGGEMAWHVTQDWLYSESFCILNCFFYFFLVLGSSLWVLGIKKCESTDYSHKALDCVLLAMPWLAGALYHLGATTTHTKVPIFIMLTFQYVVLTMRLWKLLRTPHVLWLPFLSVGVNLGFIALLKAHMADRTLNPLFHILHDVFGTEAGVAVVTALVFLKLESCPQGSARE